VRVIVLHVRGLPKSQPRPRFFRGRVIATASKDVKAWKDSVTRCAHATQAKLVGAVAVDATLFLPTKDKARWGKPHLLKPDRDNLDKAILDALTTSKLWEDDCQAWSGGVRKVWCQPGHEGAVILISETNKTEPIIPPWSWVGLEKPRWAV